MEFNANGTRKVNEIKIVDIKKGSTELNNVSDKDIRNILKLD